MSPRIRVLLVEHVDACGAAPGDATERAAALRGCGATVEVAVLEDLPTEDLLYPTCERAPRLLHSRHRGLRGREALRRQVAARDTDLVLWASAAPGGGDAAEQVCDGVPALWWPTGWAASDAVHGELPGAFDPPDPLAAQALPGGRVGRARLSLWDGPFVLAATPDSARTTVALIEAFAEAVRARDEVDLVLLAERDPRTASHAAALGIGARVHWVGRAPREAENCWLQTAAAVVLDGGAAVAGSLVLRACAVGAPLLVAGERGSALAAALAAAGLAAAAGADAAALAAVLDGTPAVVAALARARDRAAAHDEATLGRAAATLLARVAGDARPSRAA
jgi:hypothetical protein